MVSAAAGALVILFGAGYALCFAYARLTHRGVLMTLALASYAGLAVSVVFLARALNLTGFWAWVCVAMLIGYFVAPRAIWQLCTATHPIDPRPDPSVKSVESTSRGLSS